VLEGGGQAAGGDVVPGPVAGGEDEDARHAALYPTPFGASGAGPWPGRGSTHD
jgi:hypothetical protein